LALTCASLLMTGCLSAVESNAPGTVTGSLSGEAAEGGWTKMGPNTIRSVSGIKDGEFAFVNDSVGFLCLGEDINSGRNLWLRSQDMGQTWQTYSLGTDASLESIYG